ncbi:tRNA (adenosine(37)-N6)-threonylcarbamoyltransferase complex ATPase subunit type 1 TsaE [bacterium]|nr:tRNA (adenosine(37)-N6)-threonylcarbamoyltransferase complex ATPase subunit type 1 TsaE [bacterium]
MSTLRIIRNFKKEFYLQTRKASQTKKIGKYLGGILKGGDVICLVGELGAGKTTFTQGVAKGLKVDEYVNSPTFRLINEYKGKYPVYHFDLYRIDSILEIEELGYKEYFYSEGITIIEWADKIVDVWPEERIEIYFSGRGNLRKIKLLVCGESFKKRCSEFKKLDLLFESL